MFFLRWTSLSPRIEKTPKVKFITKWNIWVNTGSGSIQATWLRRERVSTGFGGTKQSETGQKGFS